MTIPRLALGVATAWTADVWDRVLYRAWDTGLSDEFAAFVWVATRLAVVSAAILLFHRLACGSFFIP